MNILFYVILLLLVLIGMFIGIASYIIRDQRVQILKLKLDRHTYVPKPVILNSTEHHLYNLLNKWIGHLPIYIFSQVALASMINVSKNAVDFYESLEDLDNILDFVIVDAATTAPLLVIELNGPTHNSTSRKVRDNFLKRLFRDCNIPFIQIPQTDLSREEKVRDIILNNIKSTKQQVN